MKPASAISSELAILVAVVSAVTRELRNLHSTGRAEHASLWFLAQAPPTLLRSTLANRLRCSHEDATQLEALLSAETAERLAVSSPHDFVKRVASSYCTSAEQSEPASSFSSSL